MNESATGTGAGAGPDAAQPTVPAPGRPPDQAAEPEDRGDDATIAALRIRLADAEDQRLRAMADLDNVRKRCASQVSRVEAEVAASVAIRWLPVIDNLERALEHSQADPVAIIDGIRAVRDQALGVLAGLGFPRRDDVGAMFDPVHHDAVAARPQSGIAAGTVIDVVRAGYGDRDHQLRPAQVVVAEAD